MICCCYGPTSVYAVVVRAVTAQFARWEGVKGVGVDCKRVNDPPLSPLTPLPSRLKEALQIYYTSDKETKTGLIPATTTPNIFIITLPHHQHHLQQHTVPIPSCDFLPLVFSSNHFSLSHYWRSNSIFGDFPRIKSNLKWRSQVRNLIGLRISWFFLYCKIYLELSTITIHRYHFNDIGISTGSTPQLGFARKCFFKFRENQHIFAKFFRNLSF